MKNKCECSATDRIAGKCGAKGRFLIVDIACASEKGGFHYGDYDGFWVCDDCIKYFIEENKDNPHYIIIKEAKAK